MKTEVRDDIRRWMHEYFMRNNLKIEAEMKKEMRANNEITIWSTIFIPELLSAWKNAVVKEAEAEAVFTNGLSLISRFVTRSSAFRTSFFNTFLQSHVIDYWFDIQKAVKKRKRTSLSVIQKHLCQSLRDWQQAYPSFTSLSLIISLLKSSSFDIPSLSTIEALNENAAKKQRIHALKVAQIKNEIDAKEAEFMLEIQQIQNIFDILVPRFESLFDNDSDDDGIEWETSTGDAIGVTHENSFITVPSTSSIQVVVDNNISRNSSDTEVLYSTLKDSIKLIRKNWRPLIQEWKDTLRTRTRESKRVLEMEGHIKQVLEQYDDLTRK